MDTFIDNFSNHNKTKKSIIMPKFQKKNSIVVVSNDIIDVFVHKITRAKEFKEKLILTPGGTLTISS